MSSQFVVPASNYMALKHDRSILPLRYGEKLEILSAPEEVTASSVQASLAVVLR
jgi:hypothetical protein